ncbi:xyloglucan endotransglucosylase/hydrolase protein 2-like [Malania oleifera]|uniref:xyloglucan endotransglucosylase/hydrolase protein 2-like n=1 Tax=Malania oleifera TaxID=397392 RepID=UPI0025AE2AB8|nr:xyloglucan endotransglucosylase/hydrolase protein 2-like [Malania oleifera]
MKEEKELGGGLGLAGNRGKAAQQEGPRLGARFTSKNMYGSGFFSLKLKIVKTDNGIVMAIYLISGIKSDTDPGNHDELDFEFLGGWNPYILQTNVFLDDVGGREQRIPLWFFVDGIPVRLIKRSGGLRYPSKPMYVKGSVWQGNWALPKGTTTDWRKAPFKVQYQLFDIAGCTVPANGNINSCQAKSKRNWWNQDGFGQLTPRQQLLYNNVTKHLCYNYCVDPQRYNGRVPPECRGQFNPTIAKLWCWN